MKIIVCDKSTRRFAERERSFVENAEQQLPQGIGGFLDFVEEQDGELQFFGVILRERFLRDQWMCFAVAEITRRRSDQFRNFVRVLKFCAVDFNDGSCISEQSLRSGFDDAGLP
jgi:hypothetical protein